MKNVAEQLKNCLQLQEEAYKLGCTCAGLIWIEDVVFDPRINLKCRQNKCTHYGENFMCPPFVPSSQEFEKGVSRFKLALLLQRECELSAGLTLEDKKSIFEKISLKLQQILLKLEKRAFSLGFVLSMSFCGYTVYNINTC